MGRSRTSMVPSGRTAWIVSIAAVVVAVVAVTVIVSRSDEAPGNREQADVLEATLTYARAVGSHMLTGEAGDAHDLPLPRMGEELAAETGTRIEETERRRQLIAEHGTDYDSATIDGHVESIDIDRSTGLVEARVMVEERFTTVDGPDSGSNIPYDVTFDPHTGTLLSVHVEEFPPPDG